MNYLKAGGRLEWWAMEFGVWSSGEQDFFV